MIKKVNLLSAFDQIHDYYQPISVASVNDSSMKLVKIKGEFLWHHHDDSDELFLVVKGQITIKLRDQDIVLKEGEMVVIPKGVEHMPLAEEEAYVALIEPYELLNTGNVQNERSVHHVKKV
ncbi:MULTISPECIES: cupin domain-containing protein [Bacillus]|uniref:Mannose-6-phosphate isomerase n=2 Tax=Bacillus TaxID=1386 RepID=A0A0M3RAE7_9BACI|nr:MULTISPECIES: cupin domain-containing protein [Bacillus]ALC83046.1 mannose-6-phosphate isomerase [Bacillus gobiensis]MBP1082082.1 mannose-6-phosphate isomerase-like protein (cupin superfamily) [Bacillus capparidis]MED1096707.1 cupin domain-containing protein [Bacillus capparidis]